MKSETLAAVEAYRNLTWARPIALCVPVADSPSGCSATWHVDSDGQPCASAGKKPIWKKWPTRDGVWPENFNVGLALRDGYVVVDSDVRNGGHQTLAALQAQYGRLPRTVEAITPTGGGHLVYRVPVEAESSKLAGVDFKVGVGQQIAVAPSTRIIDGVERAYQWVNAPESTEVADAPEWLLGVFKPSAVNGRGEQKNIEPLRNPAAYAQRAIPAIIEKMEAATTGGRNNALSAGTYALATLIEPCKLNEDKVNALCVAIGLKLDLSEGEVTFTVDRAIADGLRDSREVDDAAPQQITVEGEPAQITAPQHRLTIAEALAAVMPEAELVFMPRAHVKAEVAAISALASTDTNAAIRRAAALIRGGHSSARELRLAIAREMPSNGMSDAERREDAKSRLEQELSQPGPSFTFTVGTVEQYVARWCTRNLANFGYISNGLVFAGIGGTESALAKLTLDASREMPSAGQLHLQAALSIWLAAKAEAVLEGLRKSLAYDPTADVSIAGRWVKAVTGADDALGTVALRQFIWQVQRSIRGLPIDNHVMPILVGKQEFGKSRAVESLLGPLGDTIDRPQVSALGDERQFFRLARATVALFDEMNQAERTTIESIKQSVTAPTLTWRVLGKNTAAEARKLASFIGTANKPVREVVQDTSGARRFWEYRAEARCDWETINTIDYAALWRSVDYSGPSPVTAVRDDFRARQNEEIRYIPGTDRWILECIESEEGRKFEDLYQLFQCASDGYVGRNRPSMHKFCDAVRALRPEAVRIRQGYVRVFLKRPEDGVS